MKVYHSNRYPDRKKMFFLNDAHIALRYSIALNIMIIEWAALVLHLPKIDINPRLPYKAKTIIKAS